MSDIELLHEESGDRYSYDNIGTQHWLNGHSSGLEAAAGWIKERATKLFEAGKYEEARQLREMAVKMVEDLRPAMDKRAKDHAKEFPEVISVGGSIAPPQRKKR